MSFTKGCSRNYPGGPHSFSGPSTPRTDMESETLVPTVRTITRSSQDRFIYLLFWECQPPPHTPWTGLVRNIPHPSDTLLTKIPSPSHRTKQCLHLPQDNFWNNPNDLGLCFWPALVYSILDKSHEMGIHNRFLGA